MIIIKLFKIGTIAILSFSLLACSNNENSSKSQTSSTDKLTIENKYIKNISAASLYEPLQQKGFKIDKQVGSDVIFVDCNRSNSDYNEHLRISGDEPNKIIEIRASFTNNSNGKTNDMSTDFLGFIATLPYENSNPEKAKRWVQENISKNSKTEIGEVSFEIFANSKNVRTLMITPKK